MTERWGRLEARAARWKGRVFSLWQREPVECHTMLYGCGEGWWDIIDRLVEDIFALGWDGKLGQVKQKYGSLRFYIGSAPAAVHYRISLAEEESIRTCECCGAPGRLRDDLGWIETLCDEHYHNEESDDDDDEDQTP